MSYLLTNKTKISNTLLKKLINFSIPKNTKDFKIKFKYMSEGAFMGKTIENKVTIYMNRKPILPGYSLDKELEQYGYGKPIILYTKNELLLSLIAHELRHVWQNQTGIKKTTDKSKLHIFTHMGNVYTSNPIAEQDATKYSKKIIRKYRKLNK